MKVSMDLGEVNWLAAQGNKAAQEAMAECSALTEEERNWWAYKSLGGKAATLEAWELEMSITKTDLIQLGHKEHGSTMELSTNGVQGDFVSDLSVNTNRITSIGNDLLCKRGLEIHAVIGLGYVLEIA